MKQTAKCSRCCDDRCHKQTHHHSNTATAAAIARLEETQSVRAVKDALRIADCMRDRDNLQRLWWTARSLDPQEIFGRMSHRDRGRVFSARPMRGIDRISQQILEEAHSSRAQPPAAWVPAMWMIEANGYPLYSAGKALESAKERALAAIREMVLDERAARHQEWRRQQATALEDLAKFA